jgi:hypothetical protein
MNTLLHCFYITSISEIIQVKRAEFNLAMVTLIKILRGKEKKLRTCGSNLTSFPRGLEGLTTIGGEEVGLEFGGVGLRNGEREGVPCMLWPASDASIRDFSSLYRLYKGRRISFSACVGSRPKCFSNFLEII